LDIRECPAEHNFLEVLIDEIPQNMYIPISIADTMGTIPAKRKREIKQLWLISNYYFGLCRRIKNRLPAKVLSTSIQDITNNFSIESSFAGDKRRIMILTAHLGSCALRLVTIEDILGPDISRRLQKYKTLKGDKNLTCERLKLEKQNIIHFLLRNNVGHHEPHAISNKQQYNTMETFLKTLTIQDLFESMGSAIRGIEKDIQQLITITNKQKLKVNFA
jgi:hypothetical protein